MNKSLQVIETPKGLHLSDLEMDILRGVVSGKRVKVISADLGIPQASVLSFIKKDKVKEYIQEMVDARNLALKMELPNLLMQMIEDKVQSAEAEGLTLGETTKKDIVDIIKQLNDTIKVSDSAQAKGDEDSFTKVYNQINLIQGGTNELNWNTNNVYFSNSR